MPQESVHNLYSQFNNNLYYSFLSQRYDPRSPFEGTQPGHARHLHQGHPSGPHGHAKHVRVPCVQDQDTWSHVCLDLQSEEQGEGGTMGAWGRGTVVAGVVDQSELRIHKYGPIRMEETYNIGQSDFRTRMILTN